MHCFPAICSATRLLRGDRPKDNKFAVNLSRDFKLALRYTQPSSDLRFVFESRAYLSKSVGAQNVLCKEYWTEIVALRLVVNYTPDLNHAHPNASRPPLPMTVPIPTSLAFTEWDRPLGPDFLTQYLLPRPQLIQR